MIRVKELREARGMQQKELAIDLHVTQPTISDWESERKIPSARSTKKLADYFGVSIDYLLGRTDTIAPIEQKKQPPAQGGELSEKDVRLIKWFRSLPPEKQRAILTAQDAPGELAD